MQVYVGFVALAVNLVVAVLVTLVLRATGVAQGADATTPADYHADDGPETTCPADGAARRPDDALARRRERADQPLPGG